MIKRTNTWDTRSAVSKGAHVIERIGLAMAGAAGGLFVAAHMVRADIEMGSGSLPLAMLIYGAIGFYLGIDLPPPLHNPNLPVPPGHGQKTDAVELLSAAGTFLTALAAMLSVYAIVTDERIDTAIVLLIGIGWGIGATVQITAGIIARVRQTASQG
jgi:hypothetical protein